MDDERQSELERILNEPEPNVIVNRDGSCTPVAEHLPASEPVKKFDEAHDRNGGASCEGNAERLLGESPSSINADLPASEKAGELTDLQETLALEVIRNVHAGDECEDCRKIIGFCMPFISSALQAERERVLEEAAKEADWCADIKRLHETTAIEIAKAIRALAQGASHE